MTVLFCIDLNGYQFASIDVCVGWWGEEEKEAISLGNSVRIGLVTP